MGQKGSKKADLYVTNNETHCTLPGEEVKKFVGRAREYAAVNVSVNGPTPADDCTKKRSSQPTDPYSITSVLNKAHRCGYQLSFVVPQVEGNKPSKLKRNSFLDDLQEVKDGKEDKANGTIPATSHTLYLLRPKVRSRGKKEISLKKMEATRTLLNVMIDIKQKWGFTVQEFSEKKSEIASGKYSEKLTKVISDEAAKGGRLLSVMAVEDEKATKPQVNGNGDANEQNAAQPPAQNTSPLTLRMVFFHNYEEENTQFYQYSVACHNTKCTEEALKLKKNAQAPKSERTTNVTWSENWLNIFKERERLIEVVNIGELQPPTIQDTDNKDGKGKKLKPRDFEVATLCFYEKPIRKEGGDNDKVDSYDGLTREVWAPIDNNIQENLDNEAEKYGEHGWELRTVLVTSHVRMKEDGSEFRKCAIFFQRLKKECVPESEMEKSCEDLTKSVDGNGVDEGGPSSPKDKLQKFGVAILKVDEGSKTRLKSTSKPAAPTEAEEKSTALPAIQLKKVDREKLKKEDSSKETGDKEVPWLASLEKKKKAVMESEEKSQFKNKDKEPAKVEVKKDILPPQETKDTSKKETEKKDKSDKTQPPKVDDEETKEKAVVASVVDKGREASSENLNKKDETKEPPADESSEKKEESTDLPPPLAEEPTPAVEEQPAADTTSTIVDKEQTPTAQETLPPPSEETPQVSVEDVALPSTQDILPPPEKTLPPPVEETSLQASLDKAPNETTEELSPPASAEKPSNEPVEDITKAPEETPQVLSEDLAKAPKETPVEEMPQAPSEELIKTPQEVIPPVPVEETPQAPSEEVPKIPEETMPPALVEETSKDPSEELSKAPEETISPAPVEETSPVPAENIPMEKTPTPPPEPVAKSSVNGALEPVDPFPSPETEPPNDPPQNISELPIEHQEKSPVEESKPAENSVSPEAEKENTFEDNQNADDLALPPADSTDSLAKNDSSEGHAPSIPEKEVCDDTTANTPDNSSGGDIPATVETAKPSQPEESNVGNSDQIASIEKETDEKTSHEAEKTQSQSSEDVTKSINEDAAGNDASGNKDPAEKADTKEEKQNESSTDDNAQNDGTKQEVLESSSEGVAET